MYHVVVCSRCKYVWIVQDRPKTSQCGKCRRTRKFKLLKKYHKTADKDEAKLARAFYQAQVHDQGERFDEALDAGVLEEDMDAFLSETEYLDLLGMDANAVDDAVDNIISPSNKRSEIRIIRDAFRDLDEPNIDEFLEYTREYEISDENAVIKLDGLVRGGTLSDIGTIERSEIEEKIGELFDDPADTEQSQSSKKNNKEIGSGSSHYDIILRAVEQHGDESVDSMLEYAVEQGMSRQKAIIKLEKLALSGQVDTDVGIQAISDTRVSILGDQSQVDEQEEEESDDSASSRSRSSNTSNLSQRDIMEQAITEQDSPTEDDVLAYAAEHGLQDDKAQRLLEKMRQHGHIRETSDYILRLM